MASFTITIPDEKVQDLLDKFALHYNYDPESGVTKAAFAKTRIKDYIRDAYRRGAIKEIEHQNLINNAAIQADANSTDFDVA